MRVSSSKPSTDETEIETNVETESQNWKCPSCGAENENFRQFCDGCGDPRPGAKITGEGINIESILGSEEPSEGSATLKEDTGKSAKGKKSKKAPKEKKPKKAKKGKKVEENEDEILEPERVESAPVEPEKFEASPDFEAAKPSFIVTGPAAGPKDDETTQPSPPPSGQHYYLVFVNTPASSLIKTRVSIDFDDFPVISIGRSPGNVVVVPDQEVSRRHASLSFDGDRLLLKDLKSSNGTFVYDGKGFQRVSDSVEVRPSSVLKFGTGTIVKLVSE